jgi:transposase
MFLFKKISRGKEYWYIGENKKVNGKSVRVFEIYIGTVETLLALKRKEKPQLQIKESIVFEFGISAAMMYLADQLQLRDIINTVFPSSTKNSGDNGTIVLLLMINHCIDSLSKYSLNNWYTKSFLYRYLGIKPKQLIGQRLYDKMMKITPEIISKITATLVNRAQKMYNIQFDCLLYDPTNFTTYIQSHPDRPSTLPQWGKPKDGKRKLLQINLALIVTREDGIPVFHQVYQGNENDPTEFKVIVQELTKNSQFFLDTTEFITLIFDKGNNSPKAFEYLKTSPYHFIGSLRPSTQPDLLDLPLDSFTEEWQSSRKYKTKAHRLKRKIYDVERTVIVTWYEPSAKKSSNTLETHLKKAEIKLLELQAKLNQPKYSKQTQIEKKIQRIVNKKSIRGLFNYQILEEQQTDGTTTLTVTWSQNEAAIDLVKNSFGRNILFTDQDSWTTEEIVTAYRSQWRIERNFRELKDPEGIKADPVRHWKDQTIQVHYFLCVLALFFKRLLHRIIHKAGLDWSIEETFQTLESIKEVLVIELGSNIVHRTLTQLSPEEKIIYELLHLDSYHLN